jgi:hypothetical protein
MPMQMPNVMSTIRDEENNVTYQVMAYRSLSYGELVRSVRMLHAQPKMRRRKKPLRNQVITIVTTLGASDRL